MRLSSMLLVLMVILIASSFLAIMGLFEERSVSNIQSKIETLKENKKLIRDWKVKFSNIHASSIGDKKQAEDFYKLDDVDLRDDHYCIRNWEINRKSTLIPYFLKDNKGLPKKKFYDPEVFDEIENTYLTFLNWHNDNKLKKPCRNKVNQKYVGDVTGKLINYYDSLIDYIDEMIFSIKEEEEKFYVEIQDISERSSLYFLITFLLIFIISIFVVFVDIKTSRGTYEKN